MDTLQALSEGWVATALRRPGPAYPLLSAAHILSLGLVLGSIVTLDLRLLGLFRRTALAEIGPPLARIAAIGVGAALVTGVLLFTVRPQAYAENPAFLLKLALVALAIANALALRATGTWRRALATGAAGPALKASAAASILLWIGAVLAGRWIGFLP